MSLSSESPLGRLRACRKSGGERFAHDGTDAAFTLLDFWQWSASDLVSNATRGRLAEFIVAKALGIDTNGVRDEWAAYDLETAAGLKIEVKSAAYVQSWHQEKLSSISFATPKTTAWDPDTNRIDSLTKRQADIYVFALLAHTDKSTLDPTRLEQWRFYVAPTALLDGRKRSQHSITLKSLEALTDGPIGWADLPEALDAMAAGSAG